VEVVRLLAMRDEPLSVDEVLAAVSDAGAGGTCVFVGTVRDVDGGRGVHELEYTAHPSVDEVLRDVADDVVGTFPIRALAAVHRGGRCSFGAAPGRGVRRVPTHDRRAQEARPDLEAPTLRRRHGGMGRLPVAADSTVASEIRTATT
jgi:hypothetical protein